MLQIEIISKLYDNRQFETVDINVLPCTLKVLLNYMLNLKTIESLKTVMQISYDKKLIMRE